MAKTLPAKLARLTYMNHNTDRRREHIHKAALEAKKVTLARVLRHVRTLKDLAVRANRAYEGKYDKYVDQCMEEIGNEVKEMLRQRRNW